MADRPGSSNSFSAYAVSFGSSTFILFVCSWREREEICGDLRVALSQCLQCCVKQDSHVIGGGLHDLGDLLVTKIVLEFELNHFLLSRREAADNSQQESGRFLLFELIKRQRLLAFAGCNQFLVDVHRASFFSANIERCISANRKQPGRRLPLELCA